MTEVDYDEQKHYWEGIAKRRSPSHPVIREFAKSKVNLICDALPHVRNGGVRMLEIGAGNGYFSETLRDVFDLTVLDFSDNMLAMNPMPAERKVRGDAESLPFDDDAFEVVFCANLLHHLEVPTRAVAEMKRVAKSHVILVEPNSINPLNFMFGLVVKEERGLCKFTPNYTKKLGAQVGMKLRAFTTQGVVLPNKTPRVILPFAKAAEHYLKTPMGFYNVAIFDV